MPGLTRALQGLAARVGDTELRKLEEKDLIANWAALEAKLDKDEGAFETAVEREKAAAASSVSRDVIRETKKAETSKN